MSNLLLNKYRAFMPLIGLAHCTSCELSSNLWLCLTCGALGCACAQYCGTDGNGHALAHFDATQHPVYKWEQYRLVLMRLYDMRLAQFPGCSNEP
jgi:uncharacterized UBP type Zn finger protein